MRLWNMPYTIPGQWITGFTILGLVIAPTACDSTTLTDLTSTGGQAPFGMLLNNDPDKGVLGALRVATGDSVWIYGSLKDDGTINEVTGLVLRDAEGREASLTLEHGRPKHGRSFDGSTIDITYDIVDVNAGRLTGTVEWFLSATGERQSVAFDVDLKKALEDLAAQVKELTGLEISTEPLPDSAPRIRVADLSPLGKDSRAGSFLSALAGVYVFAFATMGFLIVSTIPQIMEFTVHFYTTFAVQFVKAYLTVLFSPFIIMGNLLRGAFRQPTVILDFDLFSPTVVIPPAP